MNSAAFNQQGANRSRLSKGTILLLLTAILLLTAYLRIRHLVDFVEWPDEIFTVWQAKLNIRDGLIHFDPYWPPLFGGLVWAWMNIVGPALEAQRFLSVLFSLLAVSCTYRAGAALVRLTQGKAAYAWKTGIIAALAVACMGYSVFAGVDVRGYGLLLMALPLTLWLVCRWLRNPRWTRAVTVALSIALLLHTSFSSLMVIPFLTLFVLLRRPRLLLQWIVTGVVVLVLVLPIVPQFLQNNVMGRLGAMPAPMPTFISAITGILDQFGGADWFLAIVIVAAIAFVAYALRSRRDWQQSLFLLLWLLFPVLIYLTVHNKDMWRTRYMWWVATGLALFIGYAFAHLPRAGLGVAAVALVLLPMAPNNWFNYRLAETTSPPFRMVFSWLAQNIQPGDVIVIDPKCTCGPKTGWGYFVSQYFPTGALPIVTTPGTASRVWYLSTSGWPHDNALFADIQKGRKASVFVGPWYFLMRLYEGPPSINGVAFGNKIVFNGLRLADPTAVVADGQNVNMTLWWSAQTKLDRDYSFSIGILDGSGKLIAQSDGPPKSPSDTPSQTSAWQVGTYYEDNRTIALPAGLNGGQYEMVIAIYQWWDGVRLAPADNPVWPRTGSDHNYLQVQNLFVGSPF